MDVLLAELGDFVGNDGLASPSFLLSSSDLPEALSPAFLVAL